MTIKESILSFLEETPKKVSVEEIATQLGLKEASDFKLLVQTIATLEREESIQFNRQGKISIKNKPLVLTGIFRANERGFGFVKIDEDEPDIFIPKGHTNFALDGDEVEIDITKPAAPFGDRGAEGKITKIVQRKMTQIVGVFHAYNDEEVKETDLYGYVLPKDKKLADFTVFISAEGIKAVEGSVVIVELLYYPETEYPQALEGMIKKVIGHENDVGMDILEIVHAHNIKPEFNEATLEAAEKIPDEITEKDLLNRRDLRDQMIVTIDGADAKDLDDAVCVWKKENGNYHLGVHIADVSYYVTEHSPIDEEAYQRGTSVYLTDRVIPMIPHRLSNGICSLNPKVPRLTMTCEMEITPFGEVVQYDIFPSVIQTTARMTYDEVNQIIEDEEEETTQKYEALVPMFFDMKELHFILEQMRVERGAINFEDHEARVLVDADGKPEEIVLRTRKTAEKLIESFMLMANETVAKHFSDKHLPFLYRIHEHPKAEKLERFFDFASVFGVVVKGTVEKLEQTELQKVLENVKDEPFEMVINTMLLRSMQQARYSEHNDGHYGLAAEYYTHFTSPIRRYPDLVVHRLIREYQESTSEKRQEKWKQLLPEIADLTSIAERKAVDCEREVDKMKKAEYMQQHIGEEFVGVISSVAKFGFFVELENTIDGLIHLNSLDFDYFHYIEKHMALVGEKTGKVFKLGQKVTVRVEKADVDTREIDFSYVSSEEATDLGNSFQRERNRTFSKEEKSGNRKKRRRGEKKSSTSKEKNRKEPKEFGKNFQKKKKKATQPFYKKVAKKKKKR